MMELSVTGARIRSFRKTAYVKVNRDGQTEHSHTVSLPVHHKRDRSWTGVFAMKAAN